jgi:VCPO second helical-bundle domain
MFPQVRKKLVSLLQPACRRGAVTLDRRPEFPEHVAGLLENSSPCLLHRGHRHLQFACNLTPSTSLAGSARLLAMLNMAAADAQINVFHAKYEFLFWRPVTAIDPTSVVMDWCGPVPGYEDGNDATTEQVGWRPLLPTPNHPEYPSAHGSITSAIVGVVTEFLGTEEIDVTIHGSADGTAGNLSATRHFATADNLREEIVNARVWGGLHYRRSSEVAVALGAKVAHYALNHGFKPAH